MEKYREPKYIPEYLPKNISMDNAWVLIFFDKKLLMRKDGNNFYIPKMNQINELQKLDETFLYIGKYEGEGCYCKEMKDIALTTENMKLIELRDITEISGDPELFLLAGTANHILHWYNSNRYCGRCGHETMDKPDERAKLCTNCGNIIYPRISPATITAVFRGDQILLAHNKNFKQDLYSLIAGFVEPGETLEQCVEREIREEVGIKVKNIKYFTSQPWPFPDSLMMAFTAEYESGEVTVDNCEILDAGWYSADHLPLIPSSDSVAGKIIRWYRENN